MSGFMQLQIWRENSRYATRDDGAEGYFPDSYIAADSASYQVDSGNPSRSLWWAEYSAPGYMDRTDPTWGTTAVEACQECFNMYGDDDNPEEVDEFNAVLEECREADKKEAQS